MLGGVGKLIKEMPCPCQEVKAQEFAQVGGLILRKPRHKGKHKPDMVLRGFLVSGSRNAMFAHPCAQLKGGRTEHHALAIGVYRAPRRRRLCARADEQTAILPRQIIVCDKGAALSGSAARGQALDHHGQTASSLFLADERPFRTGGLRVKRSDRRKLGLCRACSRVLQEERRQGVPQKRNALKRRSIKIRHAILSLSLKASIIRQRARPQTGRAPKSIDPQRLADVQANAQLHRIER